MKTAQQLGITQEEYDAQVALANEVIDELIAEEAKAKGISLVDAAKRCGFTTC